MYTSHKNTIKTEKNNTEKKQFIHYIVIKDNTGHEMAFYMLNNCIQDSINKCMDIFKKYHVLHSNHIKISVCEFKTNYILSEYSKYPQV